MGLAKDEEGRYHVLRAESVEALPVPWNEDVPATARNLAVQERKDEALARLEERLRAGAAVEVNEDVLYELPIP